MTVPAESFYRLLRSGPEGQLFDSTRATAGPWSPHAQHGGPPAALLARALEGLGGMESRNGDDPTPVAGRFTMDLLGPVPVEPLLVRAEVLRPGRRVSLRQAELVAGSGRVVARAQAWMFPEADGPGEYGEPPAIGPEKGHYEDPPAGWSRGYLDAVEWRWLEGAVTRPGPALVWMRPRIPLVEGEELSPLQRLLTCIDSASGASAALDTAAWSFMNTDLTVHVVRPMTGEWVLLDAETVLGPGSVGLAGCAAYDGRGLVGRSAQALLVAPQGS